jgi:DNA-binding transcriptional LysR family regulator
MKLRWLRAAVAVHACGRITTAAARLQRAPSSVSTDLAALERAVGAKLYRRTRDRLVPEPAADRLDVVARRVLTVLDHALAGCRAGNLRQASEIEVWISFRPAAGLLDAVAGASRVVAARSPHLHLVPRFLPPGVKARTGIVVVAGEARAGTGTRREGNEPNWQVRPAKPAADPQLDMAVAALRDKLRQPAHVPPPRFLGIEIRHLRCFVAVFSRAGVGRGARELGVAQPAATLMLAQLEKGVRQRLFDRTPFGLQPTPHATMLHGAIAGVLADLARLHAELRALGTSRIPALRIGLIPALDEGSLIADALAYATAAVQHHLPNVALQVTEAPDEDLRRLLLTGTIDFAIVDSAARQPGLRLRQISREPLMVISGAGAGAPKRTCSLEDLRAARLVMPGVRIGLRRALDQAALARGLPVRPAAEIDSLAAAMRLVRDHGWVTLLPASAVRRAVQAGELRMQLLQEPTVYRQLCVVQRIDSSLSTHAAMFISAYTQHVATVVGHMGSR